MTKSKKGGRRARQPAARNCQVWQ